MAKYIPLDALVAEIERLKDGYLKHIRDKFYAEWSCGTLDNILSFLDTIGVKEIGVDLGDPQGDKSAEYIIDTKNLEVKEVDLETELNKWRHSHFHGRRDRDADGEYLERISQLELAKHFYSLGLAQKGK